MAGSEISCPGASIKVFFNVGREGYSVNSECFSQQSIKSPEADIKSMTSNIKNIEGNSAHQVEYIMRFLSTALQLLAERGLLQEFVSRLRQE